MSERTKKGLQQWVEMAWAWVKQNKFISSLIVIAIAFVIFMLFSGQGHGKAELIRTIIFGLGALGGLYGLVMAKQRLDRFSKQVETQIKQADTAQEQLFNERLGRGVTLLKDGSVTMRRAGIRVLEDLGKTSSQEQAKLIVEIIHDFVREKAIIQVDSELIPRKDKLDVELAVFAIAGLIKKAKMKAKQLLFSELDLRDLEFNGLKLPKAQFYCAQLNGAEFNKAKLYKANFFEAELQKVDFWDAELHSANFRHAKLSNTEFYDAKLHCVIFQGSELGNVHFPRAELHRANFQGAKLLLTGFDNAELQNSNFNYATMENTSFYHAKLHRATVRDSGLYGIDFAGAELYGADFSIADFSNTRNLTKEQINTTIFEDGKPPKNLPIDIDAGGRIAIPKSRAYIFVKGANDNRRQQFVMPKKEEDREEWSGQWVDEWIEKEIAEAQAKAEAESEKEE